MDVLSLFRLADTLVRQLVLKSGILIGSIVVELTDVLITTTFSTRAVTSSS